jgi:hypothetical protein
MMELFGVQIIMIGSASKVTHSSSPPENSSELLKKMIGTQWISSLRNGIRNMIVVRELRFPNQSTSQTFFIMNNLKSIFQAYCS